MKKNLLIISVKGGFISYFQIFFEADFVGKSVLLILGFSSVYIWSVIFKKFFLLAKLYANIKELKQYVQQMPKLKRLIVEETSPHFELYDEMFNLYLTGYMEEDKNNKINAIIDKIIQQWEVKLEQNLDYLSIIGSIAPFVGLFGTVWGIMNSFQSIATSNASSISIVAPGISEALFATAIGLFVAIPAVIATNLFYAKIEALMKDLKLFSFFILNRLTALQSHCKI